MPFVHRNPSPNPGPGAVTLIIVNYNGKGCIERCLKGVRQQVFQNFECVVVDNGSSDGSAEWIETHHPEIQLIRLPENAGFCRANNMAIQKTRSEFVGLLNNDAVADPFWLSRLVAALKMRPEAGFAASKMLYSDAPHIIDRAGDGYTRSGAGRLRGRGARSDAYNQIEWIFGACAGAAVYRKAMLDTIGLFDEDFFLLYEDVDLSFRAQLKGFKCIYVPDARVYHLASRTLGYDSPVSIYYGHRNLEWVYLKNMPGPLLWMTLPAHLFYILLSGAYFVSKGKGGSFFKAKTDALKTVPIVLKKRKKIQNQKTVSNACIRRLLDKETYFERLIHRLKKEDEKTP